MRCGCWAIGNLPMAQAISLAYSARLFVTIAAVIFLQEKVRMRRWSAVINGFIGVLVIVQPGRTSFSVGTLVALSAAVLSAIVAIQIKQLSRVRSEEPTSELQSLIRISYAVFCLKKQIQTNLYTPWSALLL